MENYKLSKRVQKSIIFLNDHPGVNTGSHTFMSNLNWWMMDVCKNGEVKEIWEKKNPRITIYKEEKTEFRKYFDKYKDEDDDTMITVPYKVIYGCDWEYAKTVYAGDYAFYKYSDDAEFVNFLKTKKDGKVKVESLANRLCFQAYQGGYVKSDSYENLIIKIAKDVKGKYGNFGYSDFLTNEEIENHKTERPFDMVECEKEDEKFGKCFRMLHNENYMDVTFVEKNRRWWDWFSKSEYYKKNWKNSE